MSKYGYVWADDAYIITVGERGQYAPEDLIVKLTKMEEENAALRAENERLQAAKDALIMQARIWAGEAKAQRATVTEVGALLGGIPDWGPIAAKVEEALAECKALRAENEQLKNDDYIRGLENAADDLQRELDIMKASAALDYKALQALRLEYTELFNRYARELDK